ncbi:MAG: type IV pilin [Candidatus Bathyarchaeota archaeon]|nr:type IV pilin [Candidatus Bathyarchaeota archaeon]
MRDLQRNRLALSTVVTTLIILVVSVLLAGVVSYFAINVTSTRVQEESVHLTKQHVWHDGDSSSQAAFLMINTGGRDLVIDKISVRGQESLWTTVFYNVTSDSISDDLPYVSGMDNETEVDLGNESYDYKFLVAGNDITVRSGFSIIVYITSPDSISVNDIGLTVGMTVHTSQAMYYKECNVEATG